MIGTGPLPSAATDGLRLTEDEVMAVIGVRRRSWPTTFLTVAEQSGHRVDDTQGRRMVERGGYSLVARGLARVIDGRFVLSGAVTRLLDPLDSPAHTVVFGGATGSPSDPLAPVIRFCRHGTSTFVDSASASGIRTLRIASDDECTRELEASVAAVFDGLVQDSTAAVHVLHPEIDSAVVTTVTRGRVTVGQMTSDGHWSQRTQSPFLAVSDLLAGFVRD
ncbi:hypothetical protein [Williamsia maris]|uniref:Uncharacterized protein n=1 Tax=Williamsia maris TaxID=72806 RepID=A0ABT1HCJ7_9NOCA|nr:hypothetical protein [Williamsia maris]MCP2174601.1 hypothetical protein [Williamsia maris]